MAWRGGQGARQRVLSDVQGVFGRAAQLGWKGQEGGCGVQGLTGSCTADTGCACPISDGSLVTTSCHQLARGISSILHMQGYHPCKHTTQHALSAGQLCGVRAGPKGPGGCAVGRTGGEGRQANSAPPPCPLHTLVCACSSDAQDSCGAHSATWKYPPAACRPPPGCRPGPPWLPPPAAEWTS